MLGDILNQVPILTTAPVRNVWLLASTLFCFWHRSPNGLGQRSYRGVWSREHFCVEQCCRECVQQPELDLCSDSDGETLPEPRPGYSGKIWWARLLEQPSRALGFQTPEAKQEIRVISCCSGGCTEATAYKDPPQSLFVAACC